MKARGDSWSSVDSFAVVSVSDFDGSDDGESEQTQQHITEPGTAAGYQDEVRITVDASDAAEVDSGGWEDIAVECESAVEPSWSVTITDDSEAVAALEPHKIVADYCEHPQPIEEDDIGKLHGRTRSRSSDAKEALIAFYLGRAKLSETRSKAFVVTPPPPVDIPPLKAPERYSVAVREEVLRIENERRAQTALDQFYRRREDVKQKRAALNRWSEFKVYQSQCGLATNRAVEQQR